MGQLRVSLFGSMLVVLCVFSMIPVQSALAQEIAPEMMLTSNVVVITADELEKGLYGYDLFDVLAALRVKTGITVKSSSDRGAEDWLLIRGLPRDSARNVLVLVDGRPLNDAFSEANEFEHLPHIGLIEKIIVYKPPMPPRFGGYTAAVEVLTKRRQEERETQLSGAFGELTSGFATLEAQGPIKGGLSYNVALDYLRTDNLTGERRTPPKQNEVYGDRSYWKVSPVVKLNYDVSPVHSLSFYSQYLTSRKFFSDEIFRGEREHRDRDLYTVNVNYFLRPSNSASLTFNAFRTGENDELNVKLHPDVRDQERAKTGMRGNMTLDLPLRQRVSFGGDFTWNHAVENLGMLLQKTDMSFGGLYVEDVITPFNGLSLHIGVRFDAHSEADSRWSPYGSVSFRPFKPTLLYATWGRSIRWPSLNEFNEKDPAGDLQAEDLKSFEAGLVQEILPGRLSIKGAFFHLDLEKESRFFVDFTKMPPVAFYRNATDKVRSQGLEVEADFTLFKGLTGFVNYTYDEVERRPSGDPVDFGGPRNLVNVGLTYTHRKGFLTLLTRYGGEAEGVQAMMAPPTKLGEWFVVDLAGLFRVTKTIDFFLRASNLFDENHETFDGRPMFGRVVVGGMNVRF
ncbi:MAG: TonB-dependent receptor [candidate division NC10 bacterium]|nr:TonB-dependent receptor [candidate division NC10 bacterium]